MKNLLESIRAMYAPQSEATMMQDDGKVVHNCAKHVEHAEWGQGNCISEEHAAPDADGNIAWYDVMFEHGVERQVPTQNLKILQAETHVHNVKKAKKVAEAAPNAPTSIDPKQAIKKKAMDDALDAANKQGTTGEIDKIVHQGVNKEDVDFEAEIARLNLSEEEIQDIEEKYMGMKKLTGALKAKGATNAPGLAAWIGRKKYGKEKFQAAAAAGHKLKEAEEKEKFEDDDEQAAGHKKTKAKYETMSKMPERMKEDVDETIIHKDREYSIDEADKNYDAYFRAKLKTKGKSIDKMDDAEKKAFFKDVDNGFKAKNEDVFLEAYMASDLQAVKDAHRKAGNKISDETTGTKAGQAHHSFVVTTPEGKRTRHIYHGSTKKVETMSAAPRSKQAKETGEDEDDK